MNAFFERFAPNFVKKLRSRWRQDVPRIRKNTAVSSDVITWVRLLLLFYGPLSKASQTVALRIKQLGDTPIRVRCTGEDKNVIHYVFYEQYHLPPPELSGVRNILDAGANIGCTVAHMANVFPEAFIVGVELDERNAALCRENVQPWADRCLIAEGAIWFEDGEVVYETSDDRQDAIAAKVGGLTHTGRTMIAQAISMNSVLREYFHQGTIDYLKMDIEGAERVVLKRNTEWTQRVRCLKVELHGYTPAECSQDLQKLGFRTWIDQRHSACVVAMREELAQ